MRDELTSKYKAAEGKLYSSTKSGSPAPGINSREIISGVAMATVIIINIREHSTVSLYRYNQYRLNIS